MSDFFNLDFLDDIDVWDVVGGGLSFLQEKNRGDRAEDAASQMVRTNQQYLEADRQQREPYSKLGAQAAGQLQGSLNDKDLLQEFRDTDWKADPGYKFRFDEGMRAQRAKENAVGGLYSTAALRAGQRYGQGMATQEYGNAYNRFNNDKRQKFNFLSGAMQPGLASYQPMYPAYSSIADAEAAGTTANNTWSPFAAAYNSMDERQYANNNNLLKIIAGMR